jgi:hypothetical protein
LPVYKALELLSSMVPDKIDIDVFNTLKLKILPFPPGTGVLLSTGEKGIVIKNNYNRPTRPIVKLIFNEYGEAYRKFENIDMLEEFTVFIKDTCVL